MKTNLALILAVAISLEASAVAQTPQQIHKACSDLRNDKIPGNCGTALAWLYPQREKLKDKLAEELYQPQTDPQEAAAIMFILFNAKSFVPDQRFVNLVATTLSINDKKRNPIRYAWGEFDTPFLKDDENRPPGSIYDRWEYVNAHYDVFEPVLTNLVGTTKDPWLLWASAWLFKVHGSLKEKAPLFTPEVLGNVAANLRDDKISDNAAQAVRLYLLLGAQSVPALNVAAESKDRQARSLAKATLDALKGNHRAWGFLTCNVDLTYQLFGEFPEEPAWLTKATEEFSNQDNPHYP